MAKNNNLCMREEEFQAADAGLGRSSTGVGDVGAGIPSKFSGAVNSGLMGKSVSAISKEMSLISSSISNMRNIVKKHSNEMFTYDRTMAKIANDIDIPTDFLAENAMKVNEFNTSLLGKIDGRSVNEGEQAKEFKEIDDNTVSAEALKDISGNVTEQQDYDASSVIGKSVLGNIVKEETEEKEYDDSSSVQTGALSDISSEATQKQELDESTVLGKSILGSVNTASDTDKKEYDANVSVAATNLTGMDATPKAASAKTEDEAIIQAQGMTAAAFTGMAASEQTKKTNEQIEEAMRKVDEQHIDDFKVDLKEEDEKDHQ